MNYKLFRVISVHGLIKIGLKDKIDFNEASILDWINDQYLKVKEKQEILDNLRYCDLSYRNFNSEIGLITYTKDTFYRKLKKFVELKLLVKHPQIKSKKRPLYATTSLFHSIYYESKIVEVSENKALPKIKEIPKTAKISNLYVSGDVKNIGTVRYEYNGGSIDVTSVSQRFAVYAWLLLKPRWGTHKYHKDAKLLAWGDVFHKMINDDKHDVSSINKNFLWAINDVENKDGSNWYGWSEVIRSPEKFREKYDLIATKRERVVSQSKAKTTVKMFKNPVLDE